MTRSNAFRDAFIQKCRHAIQQARAVEPVKHAGERGDAREIFIGDLLAEATPPDVNIAKGTLTDVAGAQSDQIDVVLYSPSILPALLFDQSKTKGMIPVEAALYTIEVKSKLTKRKLTEAVANARSIRALSPQPTDHWTPLTKDPKKVVVGIQKGTPYPVSTLFAFKSDLKADPQSELRRYFEVDENAATDPAISVICIVGRGYWYKRKKKGWRFVPANDDYAEVMSFLAGTTNTIPQLIIAKGQPPFGRYLSDEADMLTIDSETFLPMLDDSDDEEGNKRTIAVELQTNPP